MMSAILSAISVGVKRASLPAVPVPEFNWYGIVYGSECIQID